MPVAVSQTTEINADDTLAKYPLQLSRNNANHVRCHIQPSKVLLKSVTQLYTHNPYLICGQLLVHHQVRLMGNQTHLTAFQSVPTQITECIMQYYFVEEDGLHQLAYEIFTFFGEMQRILLQHCPKKVLIAKIKQYLGLKGRTGTVKAKYYCDQLVKLSYIKKNEKSERQKHRSYGFTDRKLALFHSESLLKYYF